jgi:uncharacterized protein (TIRG00374 family)
MNKKTAAKFTISAALLVYVFAFQIDTNEIYSVLTNANPLYYFAAYLFSVLGVLTSIVRWKLIIADSGNNSGLYELLKLYFIGIYYNTIIPGSISGDAVRAYKTAQHEDGDSIELFMSVPVERLSGLIAILIVSSFSILYLSESLASTLRLQLLATIIIVTSALLSVTSGLTYSILQRIVARVGLDNNRIPEMIDTVRESMNSLRNPRLLFTTVSLSLIFMIITFSITFLIARSVGTSIPFLFIAAVLPIVTLATMLPISFSGLGVREGLYVYFFDFVGVEPVTSVAIGLLSLSLRIPNTLIGAALDLWITGVRE